MSLSRLVYLITGRQLPRRKKKKQHKTWKQNANRSKQYCAWIRTLNCLVPYCDLQPIHAAHTGHDGGMGIKSSDWSTVPLCPLHHLAVYHLAGKDAFEIRYGIYLDYEVRRLNAEYISLQSQKAAHEEAARCSVAAKSFSQPQIEGGGLGDPPTHGFGSL